jgi:polyferredoxin
MKPESMLRIVKIAHTLVWAVFAGSILAIPAYTFQGRWGVSAALVGFVLIEIAVLAFNGMRCPLTDMAARYTEDRRDNFDIYLPIWLARHNKLIFGTLFAMGMLYTLIAWVSTCNQP